GAAPGAWNKLSTPPRDPPEFRESFCRSRSVPTLPFRNTTVRFDRAQCADRLPEDSVLLCRSLPRQQRRFLIQIPARIPFQELLFAGVFRTDPLADRNACR